MHSIPHPDRDPRLARETARRRTFAIISHPDAGKTTLTEKLLLYSGALDLAGSVRARKSQRHATSDWMAMERERGISITSTVLQFEAKGALFNLLDTPGHQDFSEDTYRVLTAVDSAVMVLDAAKGVEPQTIKLFQVCRRRRIPILTFVNKLDHPGREPLELLDEIEKVLGIGASPLNWPIGTGPDFQGVYDRFGRLALLFERSGGGRTRVAMHGTGIDDPGLRQELGEAAWAVLQEDVALLEGAGAPFDLQTFLRGEVSPVFFGSALTNFGVEPFLDALVGMAPPPGPRDSDHGPIDPAAHPFSGFVFKIQANMDPQHRDRVAFLRVCSGRFERDMLVHHPRLGRKIRLSRPHRLFARERETVEEAFPGDVVGLVNPGLFVLGDTVSAGQPVRFEPIPRFPAEHFALLRPAKVEDFKRFHKGLQQLEEEGAVQVFTMADSLRRDPVLAVVGQLQFDVVQARLQAEYSVESRLERLNAVTVRWVDGEPALLQEAVLPAGTLRVVDRSGAPALLFPSDWALRYAQEKNPQMGLRDAG